MLIARLPGTLLARLCAVAAASRATAGSTPVSGGASPELVELTVPEGPLKAFVAPAHGADLAGLRVWHKGQWSELLYRGMDYRATAGWSGKAPILWPAVGRTFVNPAGAEPRNERLGWVLHGKEYPIVIHGFARDVLWQVVKRGVALQDEGAVQSTHAFAPTCEE